MQRTLDSLVQVLELDRLHEVVHRAVRQRFGRGRRVVHGGQHHDRHVAINLRGQRHDFDTGHARHPDVAEHQHEALTLEDLERSGSAVSGQDFIAARPQKLPEREANGFFVVDDQDALRPGFTDRAEGARWPGGRSWVGVAHDAC